MGGSARYRYGKKIANARANGESDDVIADLEHQRDDAIAREKAGKAARTAESKNISAKDQKKVASFIKKYNINEVGFFEQYRRWEEELNNSTDKKQIKQIQKRLEKMRGGFQYSADINMPEFQNWKQDLDDYNGDVRSAVWDLTQQAENAYKEMFSQYLANPNAENLRMPDRYAPVESYL